MVGRLNLYRKGILTGVAMAICFLIAVPSQAQKKKSKKDKGVTYAYQTYSTTQPKERKKGYAGSESKFHFEKPLAPVPYGKIDRPMDYSKAPYFGHKRLPTKRSRGNQRLCKVCGIMH